MKKYVIKTSQIEGRPNYHDVIVDGKKVSVIRYPSTNPHLLKKTIKELAEIECNRIFNENKKII